jgi:predicted  nucleic acid-binding Zn-ribbon protein
MVKGNDMELDTVEASDPVNRRKGGHAAKDAAIELRTREAAEPLQEGISDKLEDKLQQARTRLAAITAERKTISLAAHMGSAEDRARLDQLNQEGAVLSGEVEGIEAAIAEVQVRAAAAKRAAAMEADRQKRQGLVQLASELGGHGSRIDDLWRQSAAEYFVLQRKLHEIAQSGVNRPSQHQVQSACRRALVSAFIGTPLQLELLPPSGRHTVADLVATWVRNVEGWANQKTEQPSISAGKDAA